LPYSAVLALPPSFACEKHQQWLEKTIIKVMYNSALRYLPSVLMQMSQSSGLNYESLELGTARTHWGTCRRLRNKRKTLLLSSRPDTAVINIGGYTEEEKYAHKIVLSAFTALLPMALTRFILLHELTHTRHPDHSDAFHSTLNRLTQAVIGMTERDCQKQMKNYHTNIFSFAQL
jgi:predicted metal-dependent hydrolase